MSLQHTVLALAVASTLSLLAGSAFSQTTQGGTVAATGSTAPAQQLSSRYTGLAGSPKNATSLVSGLRNGTSVTLESNPNGPAPAAPPATFTPATGKLGYGNVNIALSLAKADLAKQGIANPTPSQLAAALNGGAINTSTGSVTMAGVLSQRSAGMGWGQIAHSMGVKLGAVVSASKTGKTAGKSGHASTKSGTSSHSGAAHSSSSQGASGGNGGGGHGGGGGGHGGK